MFIIYVFVYLFIYLCLFLQPHLLHMEVPRLGVKSELWLLVYTTATATRDLSQVLSLRRSSGQRQILNPLIWARIRTCVLMVTSQMRFH